MALEEMRLFGMMTCLLFRAFFIRRRLRVSLPNRRAMAESTPRLASKSSWRNTDHLFPAPYPRAQAPASNAGPLAAKVP